MPLLHRQVGVTAVLEITGTLALGADTERLESLVKELSGQGRLKFVFDVSGLDYSDSAGVGAMVSCLTTIARAGGESRVAGAKPRFRRVLLLTGLDHLLQFYPSVEAAVGA